MIRIVLLFGLLAVMIQFNYGQEVIITEAGTGIGIEGVILQAAKASEVFTTDKNGRVDISGLKLESSISIIALGFIRINMSYDDIQKAGNVIELRRMDNKLDEVVVSATKTSQSFRNVSSRITKIEMRDLYLHNPQNAADLLGTTGEVFIQKSQQGGGSPMIRGFSANRLLYTVDGIRMNNAIFRAGNLQNVISLDGLAMENVEIFFGPGSIIYGSDAIGGVMSFQTISPKLSSSEKVKINANTLMRYSTANNEKTGHLDISYGSPKFAGVSSVTYSDFGNLRMGNNGPEEYLRPIYVKRVSDRDSIITNPDPKVQVPTSYNQLNVMQKVRYRPNDTWDINYGFHFSETSEYSRYDRLIETVNGQPRSAVWNYGPQKWNMHALSVGYTDSNSLFDQGTLRLASQRFEESRIDRNFSGGQRFRLRNQAEDVRAYSANLDLQKKVGKNQLVYGLEYVFNDVKSTGSATDIRNNNPINVSDRYPASTWTSMAAYATIQFNPNEKLSVNGGLRWNGFQIKSDFTRHLTFFPFEFTATELYNSATTGSIGLIFRPEENLKISISGSTGFRAPNVDDIGKIFDFGPGEVVVPNTNLNSEYAYNGEISIFKAFGDLLHIDFSAYYTYLDNAMVRRAFQVGGRDSILYNGVMAKVFAIQNAAFGDVYGFQTGIELKITQHLTLRTQYSYQIGNEELDKGTTSRSRHAAPAFGISRLMYKNGKLNIETNAQYSSEVSFDHLNEEERQKPAIYAIDAVGNPYSPKWYTINLKAGYMFNKSIQLFAGIENITDQRYRPYSSGLVAPGRNGIVSLNCKF